MEFVIEHLSKHFEKKEVLRDIDFTFEEGKIYGLLGRLVHGAGAMYIMGCNPIALAIMKTPRAWRSPARAGWPVSAAAAAQRGSMPYPTVCSRLVSVSAWRTAGWAPSL